MNFKHSILATHSDLTAVQSVSYFRTKTCDMTETIIFSKILKKHPPISQITLKDITNVFKPFFHTFWSEYK